MPAASRILLALAMTALAIRQNTARAWQSDVRIAAVELRALRPGGAISARVTVTTRGDPARAVRLEILLPIGVAALRMGQGCRASPSPVESLSARITCLLGDVPNRATRVVVIVTTTAPPAGGGRFAVFAFSDTPDPVPSNNFAEHQIP